MLDYPQDPMVGLRSAHHDSSKPRRSSPRLHPDRARSALPPTGRILVVDDSLTVIEAVKRAFTESPYEVESVDHYLEIPRYFQQTPPDLVILDLEIPFLPGERISAFIRQSQPRETPIVIFSSAEEQTLEATASRIRAVGWISKQSSMEQLVTLVSETLTARLPAGDGR